MQETWRELPGSGFQVDKIAGRELPGSGFQVDKIAGRIARVRLPS